MEHRKNTNLKIKSSPLPLDYLKMVSEIFATHFDEGLKLLAQLKPEPKFLAQGEVFADEIVLTVSIVHEGQIGAISVYSSVDFEPKASSPTTQDLLGACVDALAGSFGQLLDPKNKDVIKSLADDTLAALEDVPFDWTPYTIEKHKVYIRVDRANPVLDKMTDKWLEKHDPLFKAEVREEEKETESLFVTGPRKKPSIH